MATPDFVYSNLSDRSPGRLVTITGWALRGVARVQAQVVPYAEAWQRDNAAALAATGPLWVALGDSLTQGIGASAHDRGWVGQLRDRLAAEGRPHRVINLAFSGAKTVDVLARQLPVLDELRPDLVTLMIGSNDLMRPKNRRGLSTRIAQILERLPVGAVVTTLPNPTRPAREANAVIERVAARRGLVVADLRDRRLAGWRGKLAEDHFHPNEQGYRGIAEIIGDAVLVPEGQQG